MTTRTSKKTVTFRRPFVLGGLDMVLPAGAYSVETDEELLEGISFPAYRRVLTVMHLHAKPGHPGITQTLTVDPNDLDAALQRDQAPLEIPFNWDANVGQSMLGELAKSRREEADCRAMDRADDEGMLAHPS